MDLKLQNVKRTLRAFMREHYSDERLAWLLAHACSGKLVFHSCCCFIGVVTAEHTLQGEDWWRIPPEDARREHVAHSRLLPGAVEAEFAFLRLTDHDDAEEEGRAAAQRRRRLIPIILAEMRRRSREREPVASEVIGGGLIQHATK